MALRINHSLQTFANVGEVTYHAGSGTDDTVNVYMNLMNGYFRVIDIVPDATITMTKVDNQEFNEPLTINTNGFTAKESLVFVFICLFVA